MKRFRDYEADSDKDGQRVDGDFVDRIVLSRYVSFLKMADGQHRTPKSRVGSKAPKDRPGFKKRPRKKG
jgi:hypothetical protein